MRKYGLIKLGLAAVMLTSASAASEGADVSGGPTYPPPPPPIPFVYNWTGFYAGAHVGVGWSDGDGSGSSDFIGGGQVGFNYQINQWVLGVEGDFAGTTIKDSVNAAVVGPGAVITGNAEASLDFGFHTRSEARLRLQQLVGLRQGGRGLGPWEWDCQHRHKWHASRLDLGPRDRQWVDAASGPNMLCGTTEPPKSNITGWTLAMVVLLPIISSIFSRPV